jgi:hypothetical protein
VLSISSLLLGPTVLYCHFVACSVVQQPARNKVLAANMSAMCFFIVFFVVCDFGLTKKAEPQPTRDVNRDSGTDSANGGWLRREAV